MGILHTITAGGQTWTHRVRMLRQVIKFSSTLATAAAALSWIFSMLMLPSLYYSALFFFAKAKIAGYFTDKVTVNRDFWANVAHTHLDSHHPFVTTDLLEKVTAPYANKVLGASINNLHFAVYSFICTLIIVLLYFLFRGMSTTKKNHLSGQRIRSPRYVRWLLKIGRKASDIELGKVPLVKGTETQHMLITGGTGSGKTNCLHHLLRQIRTKGDRAIVVDTTGVFLERYFKEGKDHLLNPFKEGTELWSPWAECKNRFDYESLAESLIPQSHSEHENYWRTSSRTVLSSLFVKLSDSKKTSELVDWLLYRPLADLCQLVEGTKAAAHMDIRSEKTAASIRSVASSFVGCFEHIKDVKNPFSIKSWIENETQEGSWLFLNSLPSQRSSLNPLLSAWLSVAVRSMLNLLSSNKRRIWFILDELPTLNKVKDLEILLAEGRKYGGCAVLSLQSPSQLEAIYGRSTASTIIGNCLTKIVFSEQDPQVSQQISKGFGEREILEYNEGLSYGAHEVRDGVSLSSQKKTIPLLTPTKIQSLNPNNAFLKLPGDWPICKIRLGISKR